MRLVRHLLRKLSGHPPCIFAAQKGYDLWAPNYAHEDNPIRHLERSNLRRILPAGKYKSVLDVGCGTAETLRTFSREGDVIALGIDISMNMLRQARKTQRDSINNHLFCASTVAIPFAANTFDLVLSSLVLGYVQDLQAAVAELARVAKIGGDIYISDFHPFGNLMGWNRSFWIREQGKAIECHVSNHLHLYEDYHAAFQNAGLLVTAMHEPRIDASVEHYFAATRNGKRTYRRFAGFPVVITFKLRKP